MSDPQQSAPSFDFVHPIPVYVITAPSRPKYGLAALLLLITTFTTLVVGARLQHNFLHGLAAFSASEESLPMFPLRWIAEQPSRLLTGVPFALALMTILLAHELGHYILARRYAVDATLPYFIPAPTLIGTLGAFIKIRSAFPSRKALFDIGIAGPIAGFLVALPVTVVGLAMSHAVGSVPESDIRLGFPLLFRVIHDALAALGNKPASPMDHLLLHPLAIAGWVGMFATSLNLLPGGQLDGGHIVYSWSPRAHRTVSILSILALLPMAWSLWVGWLIWAVVLGVTGLRHPVVYEDDALDRGRKLLLLAAIAMLVLSLIPAPFAESGIRDVLREFRSGT